MKLLLDFEEVVYYLQYNAKSEFFNNNTFPPNPECKDKYCRNQQVAKKDSIGFIKERQNRFDNKIILKKNETKDIDEEAKKWGICEIEEFTEIEIPVVGQKEREESDIGNLINQFNKL